MGQRCSAPGRRRPATSSATSGPVDAAPWCRRSQPGLAGLPGRPGPAASPGLRCEQRHRTTASPAARRQRSGRRPGWPGAAAEAPHGHPAGRRRAEAVTVVAVVAGHREGDGDEPATATITAPTAGRCGAGGGPRPEPPAGGQRQPGGERPEPTRLGASTVSPAWPLRSRPPSPSGRQARTGWWAPSRPPARSGRPPARGHQPARANRRRRRPPPRRCRPGGPPRRPAVPPASAVTTGTRDALHAGTTAAATRTARHRGDHRQVAGPHDDAGEVHVRQPLQPGMLAASAPTPTATPTRHRAGRGPLPGRAASAGRPPAARVGQHQGHVADPPRARPRTRCRRAGSPRPCRCRRPAPRSPAPPWGPRRGRPTAPGAGCVPGLEQHPAAASRSASGGRPAGRPGGRPAAERTPAVPPGPDRSSPGPPTASWQDRQPGSTAMPTTRAGGAPPGRTTSPAPAPSRWPTGATASPRRWSAPAGRCGPRTARQ